MVVGSGLVSGSPEEELTKKHYLLYNRIQDRLHGRLVHLMPTHIHKKVSDEFLSTRFLLS